MFPVPPGRRAAGSTTGRSAGSGCRAISSALGSLWSRSPGCDRDRVLHVRRFTPGALRCVWAAQKPARPTTAAERVRQSSAVLSDPSREKAPVKAHVRARDQRALRARRQPSEVSKGSRFSVTETTVVCKSQSTGVSQGERVVRPHRGAAQAATALEVSTALPRTTAVLATSARSNRERRRVRRADSLTQCLQYSAVYTKP